MRVLVCGGRDYTNSSKVWSEMDRVRRTAAHGALVVIQGGARGADEIVRDWCRHHEVPYDNYPADWKTHGKAAGPIRNQRMIDEGKPDLVVAFPGGRGTADMVKRATAARIQVILI